MDAKQQIKIYIEGEDLNTFMKSNTGIAPLFDSKGNTSESYPAFLEINLVEKTAVFGNAYDDMVPESVWYERSVRIPVPTCIHADELANLDNNEEFLGLMETVIEGYRPIVKDGKEIGSYSEDARYAIRQLEDMFQDMGQVEVWEAGDWFNGEVHDENHNRLFPEQIQNLSDDDIDRLADYHTQEALSENVILLYPASYIEELREEAKEEA